MRISTDATKFVDMIVPHTDIKIKINIVHYNVQLTTGIPGKIWTGYNCRSFNLKMCYNIAGNRTLT